MVWGGTSRGGRGVVAPEGPGPSAGAPAPDPTDSAAATSAAPAPGDGKTVTLGKATIPLTGVAKATRDGSYLCLTLVNDTGCSLEVIDIGATRAGGGSVSTPAPGAPPGGGGGARPRPPPPAPPPPAPPPARRWTSCARASRSAHSRARSP